MSNVPKARNILSKIADRIENKGLQDEAKEIRGLLHKELRRRKPARRMPVHSRSIDEDAVEEIKDLAKNTDMHSSEIAAEVGVNPGRVSEVLQGDR